MNSPNISIIIPIYKAERYIVRCLDSIVAQTYSDWECILIDDGSPDASGKVCDIYAEKDKRFQVVHKANGGVSSARNYGLDKARGKWICFIDADDYISSNYCEAVTRSDCDIVITDRYIYNNKGQIKVSEVSVNHKSNDTTEYKRIVGEYLVDARFKAPWAKFIQKSVINSTRFELSQKIGEDTVFMYEVLSKAKSIEFIHGYSYFWLQGICADVLKYRISMDEALIFLGKILTNYEKIGVRSSKAEVLFLTYFFSIADKSNLSSIQKWFETPIVVSYEQRNGGLGSFPSQYRLWYSWPRYMYHRDYFKRMIAKLLEYCHKMKL